VGFRERVGIARLLCSGLRLCTLCLALSALFLAHSLPELALLFGLRTFLLLVFEFEPEFIQRKLQILGHNADLNDGAKLINRRKRAADSLQHSHDVIPSTLGNCGVRLPVEGAKH